MVSMGATASPLPSSPEPSAERDLFSTSVLIAPRGEGRNPGLPISVAAHVLILGSLLVAPLFWPSELPPTEGIRVAIYNMPPPPPPPIALGDPHAKAQPVQPTTPEKTQKIETPKDDRLIPPVEEKPIEPEQKLSASEQQGSADGVADGDPNGMVGGVKGGVVGGVIGGTVGGCLGCEGDGLMDYDRPPQALRQPKPVYPTEAAVKRVEGKVIVEMVIDATGKVVDAKVIESIPLLDQAAVRNVYEWVFSPALKGGRPVKSLVHGVVTFRLL
jgi:periplasmic protein TonB